MFCTCIRTHWYRCIKHSMITHRDQFRWYLGEDTQVYCLHVHEHKQCGSLECVRAKSFSRFSAESFLFLSCNLCCAKRDDPTLKL